MPHTKMANRLDIVIFGVTGFTGLRTIPYVTSIIKRYNLSLTWGVAGRSELKIKKTLKEFGEKNGVNYDNVPILIADINDEGSLRKMTSRARIIINATGPYVLYGEPVVKACLETSTHHVDVSGESLFIEKMQLLYHDEAKSKGVYIVSACGLDSIPADMGIVFLKNNFEGTLNSVETYVHPVIEDSDLEGPMINIGTFHSLLGALADFFKTNAQRKLLYKTKLPSMQPKLEMRIAHRSDLVNGWCVPMPEPDLAVVNRSQRYFYETCNERPIQVNCYVRFGTIFNLMLAAFYLFWVVLFSQFEFSRKILLKYPEAFSYGIFSNKGPSDKRQETTIYNLTLRGKGWSKKLKDPLQQPNSPPNKEIVAKISGKNPAYGITCAAFALSAIMILTESDKMPERGGVYAPAAAFARTTIVEKLQENGVHFEIISKN